MHRAISTVALIIAGESAILAQSTADLNESMVFAVHAEPSLDGAGFFLDQSSEPGEGAPFPVIASPGSGPISLVDFPTGGKAIAQRLQVLESGGTQRPFDLPTGVGQGRYMLAATLERVLDDSSALDLFRHGNAGNGQFRHWFVDRTTFRIEIQDAAAVSHAHDIELAFGQPHLLLLRYDAATQEVDVSIDGGPWSHGVITLAGGARDAPGAINATLLDDGGVALQTLAVWDRWLSQWEVLAIMGTRLTDLPELRDFKSAYQVTPDYTTSVIYAKENLTGFVEAVGHELVGAIKGIGDSNARGVTIAHHDVAEEFFAGPRYGYMDGFVQAARRRFGFDVGHCALPLGTKAEPGSIELLDFTQDLGNAIPHYGQAYQLPVMQNWARPGVVNVGDPAISFANRQGALLRDLDASAEPELDDHDRVSEAGAQFSAALFSLSPGPGGSLDVDLMSRNHTGGPASGANGLLSMIGGPAELAGTDSQGEFVTSEFGPVGVAQAGHNQVRLSFSNYVAPTPLLLRGGVYRSDVSVGCSLVSLHQRGGMGWVKMSGGEGGEHSAHSILAGMDPYDDPSASIDSLVLLLRGLAWPAIKAGQSEFQVLVSFSLGINDRGSVDEDEMEGALARAYWLFEHCARQVDDIDIRLSWNFAMGPISRIDLLDGPEVGIPTWKGVVARMADVLGNVSGAHVEAGAMPQEVAQTVDHYKADEDFQGGNPMHFGVTALADAEEIIVAAIMGDEPILRRGVRYAAFLATEARDLGHATGLPWSGAAWSGPGAAARQDGVRAMLPSALSGSNWLEWDLDPALDPAIDYDGGGQIEELRVYLPASVDSDTPVGAIEVESDSGTITLLDPIDEDQGQPWMLLAGELVHRARIGVGALPTDEQGLRDILAGADLKLRVALGDGVASPVEIDAGWLGVKGANLVGELCPGDVTGDGETKLDDFAIIGAAFGGGPGLSRSEGDLTGDGFVDLADFAELGANFGAVCGE